MTTPTLNAWELAETAIRAGARRILLYGTKGLAKSRFAYDILNENHEEVYQCSLNEDIAEQELKGHYVPRGTVFEWHDGPVMAAFRGGHGLVINELGRGSGAVRDMFLGVLDDPSIALISLPSGERVRPGASFQTIATSNSSPDSLDEPLHDRFDSIIHVTTPHPSLIKYLNEQLDGMGTIIERSYTDPKTTISPRRALAFISYINRGVDEAVAAALSFGKRGQEVMVAWKALPRTEEVKPSLAAAVLGV